jgi:hypothetical protein
MTPRGRKRGSRRVPRMVGEAKGVEASSVCSVSGQYTIHVKVMSLCQDLRDIQKYRDRNLLIDT